MYFKFLTEGDEVGVKTSGQFNGDAIEAVTCYCTTITAAITGLKQVLVNNLPDDLAKPLFVAGITSVFNKATDDVAKMAGKLWDNTDISDVIDEGNKKTTTPEQPEESEEEMFNAGKTGIRLCKVIPPEN